MKREDWLAALQRLAGPVLDTAAEGRLRAAMTLERRPGSEVARNGRTYKRECFSPFEAVARLICGLSPWLSLAPDALDQQERRLQEKASALAARAIAQQLAPDSDDCAGFSELNFDHSPLLVNAAFLALALVRSKRWCMTLPHEVRDALLGAFQSARSCLPPQSNWLLFSCMLEAGIRLLGGDADRLRVDYGFRQFDRWYLGDGIYGDGAQFAADYYNSYVIQPMLLALCDSFPDVAGELHGAIRARARTCGEHLERMIAPDGSFPALGRSITYRCGAFHLLAALALRGELPPALSIGGVREALGRTICTTLAPESYRADGFLSIGLRGSQPELGEHYITTGSLYLCATAFLPMGLGPEDPFWTAPAADWTQKRLWK
ncbi:DUF2264 domain-containing protein [Ruminococcaceae bacterium OttesenSCG-928-L11]|nr:DUF2264 domain-containing protein [Ruminococcaceae bacterium OttesenSCG-928-L11]